MNITYYVRRCKYKHGNDRYEKLHAANNTHTFCGKELNEKWFIENSAGLSTNDITCNACLKHATDK